MQELNETIESKQINPIELEWKNVHTVFDKRNGMETNRTEMETFV